MKRMMSFVCGVSAAIAAVADITTPSGAVSDPMTLDIESEVRTEVPVCSLTYDTLWRGVTNADYRILINGVVLSTGSGVGAVAWHPTKYGTYTLTYQSFVDNTKVGEDMTAIFTLAGKDLVNAEISLTADEVLYDGTAKRPNATIVYNSELLTEGVDYSLEYENNVNPGVATMTIRGMGRFSDALEKNFTIRPAGICFLDIESGTRTNAVIHPIAYSPQWACTNASAVAEVAVDGVVVSTSAMEGTYVWTPPTRTGTSVLTHIVKIDGKAVGETLSATFMIMCADAPTISPPNGTVFADTQKVTLSTANANAKIYYTTDGSEPTMNSTLYSGKFRITTKTTVKAIAVVDGRAWSPTTVASYAKGTCTDPVITSESGAVFQHSGEMISIVYESGTSGCVLRYTTDGSEPTNESTEYTEPFAIDETTTVKARVFSDSYFDSQVVTAAFTREWLQVAKPTIAADSTFTGSKTMAEVSCETASSTLYFTPRR